MQDLKGLGVSSGSVSGVARVIIPDTLYDHFSEGDILVTTITDPTMVNLMIKAAGIVTDMGGMTSHPAILSREMGIPCVVNTKTATTVIKTGQKIKVDGDTGVVHVLD